MYFRCHLLPQRNIVWERTASASNGELSDSPPDYITRDHDLGLRGFSRVHD
jgi:hypothetical protein